MRIEPAIPWTFPRATPRDHALRWFTAAVTAVVATAAVLGAAMTAVMLGIT
jgi:multisubunit Na+/H+ antiporter MnhC subunit